MNDQDYDKLLDAAVQELPREINPHREISSGIKHAIEMRKDRRIPGVNKAVFAAAALIFVIGGAWLLPQYYANNATPDEISMAVLVDEMHQGFTVQKAQMLIVYEGETALTSNWKEQLHELEVARDGIAKALKDNPDNLYMIQILRNIHQQQLDLIERVHRPINRNI